MIAELKSHLHEDYFLPGAKLQLPYLNFLDRGLMCELPLLLH